jgi:hypothetical protein
MLLGFGSPIAQDGENGHARIGPFAEPELIAFSGITGRV